MKKIYPLYCNSFKCIADKCPDTCCALWEIVIDNKYRDLYKNHPSDAAKDACAAMYVDRDGDTCLRLNNGRCPMLNSENLCRIYIDMGRDALCDVCRVYPRFNKEADFAVFSGISLSCPEAARLILSDETNGRLNSEPKTDNIIQKAFDVFVSLCTEGVFLRSLSLAEECQAEIDFGGYHEAEEILVNSDNYLEKDFADAETMLGRVEFMQGLDILTEKWKNMLASLGEHLKLVQNDKDYEIKRNKALSTVCSLKEIKNTAIYYLYKYLPEAIEENDIYTPVYRSVYCTGVICELCAMEKLAKGSIGFDEILEFAQCFSKEIEHNEDNMKKLESM